MRGKPQAQPDFLTVIHLNASVPTDHPLRPIQRHVDAVLKKLSPLFDDLYEEDGRPSIPPEQLLKARVLTALFSVRRERMFCEPLGYHLLWLWFLDREFSEGRFDHSVLAKNSERVLSADVAKLFFAEGYDLSRQEGWTSDEHFTADGTLIESWASLKSFVRKDGADAAKVQAAKDEDPGNPAINFRGEQRRNDTHQSTTDSESVLYRKANGQTAKLCFGGHLLMENRQGLCADFTIHNPIAEPEPVVALQQVQAHQAPHEGVRVKTVGADKGYHRKDFVAGCREQNIVAHAACKAGVKVPGLDGRTTAKESYRISRRIGKRVEEIFGWVRTVGGLRRSRYRGRERTQAWSCCVGGTYHLLRIGRLELATAR
jgi:transposase